jgi:hypothetical protein
MFDRKPGFSTLASLVTPPGVMLPVVSGAGGAALAVAAGSVLEELHKEPKGMFTIEPQPPKTRHRQATPANRQAPKLIDCKTLCRKGTLTK